VYFNQTAMVLSELLSKRMYLKSAHLFKDFNHTRGQRDKTAGMVPFCREAAQLRDVPTACIYCVTISTILTDISFYLIHKGFNKGK
jgi:hypothetical protein